MTYTYGVDPFKIIAAALYDRPYVVDVSREERITAKAIFYLLIRGDHLEDELMEEKFHKKFPSFRSTQKVLMESVIAALLQNCIIKEEQNEDQNEGSPSV